MGIVSEAISLGGRAFSTIAAVVVIGMFVYGGYGAIADVTGVSADNPWNHNPVVVGVDTADVDIENERAVSVVKSATDYWDDQGRGYIAYNVTFNVQPASEHPDIVVRFESDIRECGYQTVAGEIVGCAPVLDGESSVPSPTVVRVESGQSDDELLRTIKHELGHTLGLDHDDEPDHIMGH